MRKQPRGLVYGLAREMRCTPTPTERAVWAILRDRRCLGLKFRRQFVQGGIIVDFYCARPRIAIEVDGAVHDSADAKERGRARDNFLRAMGIQVVRLRNADVSRVNIEAELWELLLRSPSPHGGEGDRG
jgi:very-short-patch-repair endonuclease